MRFFYLILFTFVIESSALAGDQSAITHKTYKHQFYFYWGWSRQWYSDSDIHFSGKGYNFTLDDVTATDAPINIGADPYLDPTKMTIPQFNFRIGYFFNEHWNVTFALDHMKYVMDQDQTVKITGSIYDSPGGEHGTYNNDDIKLTENFLQFEHTNGLNYINGGIKRMDNLYNLRRIGLPDIDINITEGFAAGFLYPKTNCKLMGYERNDEFHVSGYGISTDIGLNVTFFNHVFIQTELKGGYIDLPDIKTTNTGGMASQHFFFSQTNLVFGAIFQL